MSLIEEIRETQYYYFKTLLNIVDFDNLDEYVNVYDKTGINLLLWMYKHGYNESKIIEYVYKYHKLFDYEKRYNNNKSLLMKLSLYLDYETFSYMFSKINFIKEVIIIDDYNNNLVYYYYIYERWDVMCYIIKITGILNKPFSKLHDGRNLLSVMYCSYTLNKKYIPYILVNYFGILTKPLNVINELGKCIITLYKINIINKLVLVYGKY